MRSIRQSNTRPVLLSIVVSLVLRRLDYSSVILASLPHTQPYGLQSALNVAARLKYSSKKYDYIKLHHYFACYIGYECPSISTYDWKLGYCLPVEAVDMTFN